MTRALVNGDVIVLPVKDGEYWTRVADDAHEWNMLMHRLSAEVWRAYNEDKITLSEYLERSREFFEAQQVFRAEYHLALTCRELAKADCSLADFVRELSSQHE